MAFRTCARVPSARIIRYAAPGRQSVRCGGGRRGTGSGTSAGVAIGRGPRRSVDDRVALLPEELGDVVHRQAGLAGRAGALPAAERLDARPRAGGRPGPPVDVQDAGLARVEELLDLAL